MLNGLDPIIIFQLYKLVPPAATAAPPASAKTTVRPVTAETKNRTTFAIIPIYLSEQLTGLQIDQEAKNIDIDTTQDSLANGEAPIVNQKALGSITTINMTAKKGSVGLTILLALSEMIVGKVTSQEYEITYMNGAVTVFGGLIHGFSYDQGGGTDLYKIKLDLSRGNPKPKGSVVVNEDPNAVRLGSAGSVPPPGAPTVTPPPNGGNSVIQPGLR